MQHPNNWIKINMKKKINFNENGFFFFYNKVLPNIQTKVI